MADGVTGQPTTGFGAVLRQLRERAKLTQEELAEAAGLSSRAVSDLERGVHRTARKDTAELLAGALRLTGPTRGLFVAAARGREPAASVLAVMGSGGSPGVTRLGQPPARAASLPSAPGIMSQPGMLVVGRDSEVALLSEALSDARTGHGRFVLLAGEPGIGKTCLAHCLAEEARGLGVPAWWGRAWEGAGAPGFWPLIQIGRSVLQDTDPGRLRRVVGGDGPLVARLLPELYGEEAAVGERIPGDAARARFRLFDAIGRLLAEAATDTGALIVLDDLHAGDEPSLSLLRFLARQVAATRLLVLCAYRNTSADHARLSDLLADVAREPTCQRLDLARLSRAAVGQLIEIITGQPAAAGVSAAVYDRTAGNPFFTCELLRLMQSRSDQDDLAAATALIPPTVADVVRFRVTALSQTSQQVLAVACALDPGFDLGLLTAACRLPTHLVLRALDETAAAGLTVAGALPGHQHAFAHGLVRDVLYRHLGAAERARMHQRIGTTLEEASRDDPGPHLAEIASHFLRAAPSHRPKALNDTIRAGEYEVSRFAGEQAGRLFALADVAQPGEAAFEELILATQAQLFRTAFLLTGDLSRAEDLVQSALERTHQHWRRANAAGNPAAYARRVLVNLATSRRQPRRNLAGPLPQAAPDLAPVPDDQADHAHARDQVLRALTAMPTRTRTALVLRYFEKLSEAETAAAMGCRARAVSRQASRGLATLRAAMTQDRATAVM